MQARLSRQITFPRGKRHMLCGLIESPARRVCQFDLTQLHLSLDGNSERPLFVPNAVCMFYACRGSQPCHSIRVPLRADTILACAADGRANRRFSAQPWNRSTGGGALSGILGPPAHQVCTCRRARTACVSLTPRILMLIQISDRA